MGCFVRPSLCIFDRFYFNAITENKYYQKRYFINTLPPKYILPITKLFKLLCYIYVVAKNSNISFNYSIYQLSQKIFF